MKNIKFAVLACGLLGLIGCFLPMVSAEGMSVMGAMGAAKGFKRPQGIAALVGFAFVIFKFRGGFFDLLKAAIGAKLMFIAAIAGVVVAALAMAMPEDGQ